MVKWSLQEGVVPATQIRELTATCAAMCASRSLRDVLQYVVPVTQSYINANENRRPDSKARPNFKKVYHSFYIQYNNTFHLWLCFTTILHFVA